MAIYNNSSYIYTTDCTSWAMGSATLTPLQFTMMPTLEPAPPVPPTAIDWLRSRVSETCDAAFEGIAA